MIRALVFVFACLSGSAQAQNSDEFIRANLLSVLYHELGHAIIDLVQLPVFGQEVDAADVASILLINELFDEATATEIAYDSAFGFLGEARTIEQDGQDPAWWDLHGPDLQRYYNLVCLFAGANVGERSDIANELGLPQDRLDTCEEEFTLADDSWGPVFDDLAVDAPGTSMDYDGATDTLAEKLVAEEVAALNRDFSLPQNLAISVASCGEPNAFYDPETVEIIMCAEMVNWLRELPVD
jgi:hypothetical protein